MPQPPWFCLPPFAALESLSVFLPVIFTLIFLRFTVQVLTNANPLSIGIRLASGKTT